MELWIISGVIALMAIILGSLTALATPESLVTVDSGRYVRFRMNRSQKNRLARLQEARKKWQDENPSEIIRDEIWHGAIGSLSEPTELILFLR